MRQLRVNRPWRTDRDKRGERLIVVESGDTIWIGDLCFNVVRVLEKGRIIVRQANKPKTGTDLSGVREQEEKR